MKKPRTIRGVAGLLIALAIAVALTLPAHSGTQGAPAPQSPQSSTDQNFQALARLDKNLDRLSPKARERVERLLSAGGAHVVTVASKRAELAEAARRVRAQQAGADTRAVPAEPLPAGEGSDPFALE